MNAADDLIRKCVLTVVIFGLFLVNFVDSTTFFPRSLYSEPTKSIPGPEKNYTGIRIKEDSLLLIYYHEQTLAIVETDENRILHNCELLEVRPFPHHFFQFEPDDVYSRWTKHRMTKADKQVALKNLKAIVPTQMRIAFTDMLDLMHQCNKLDFPPGFGGSSRKASGRQDRQFTSIFSGLFPGTKWCGSGDAAFSYHDLGQERDLDKCCRNHDLCPVKVAGLKTQYNLTNYALYTKSHCACDDFFYDCLKAVDTTFSKTIGRIYFNVSPVVCVEDVPVGNEMKTKKQFTTKRRRFS